MEYLMRGGNLCLNLISLNTFVKIEKKLRSLQEVELTILVLEWF